MKIQDVTLDDLRQGTNWRAVNPNDYFDGLIPLQELSLGKSAKFSKQDYVIYSVIYVIEPDEVRPLLMMHRVGDMDYGGCYCHYVNGQWQESGLEPDPNYPVGKEYVANPLPNDHSFVSSPSGYFRRLTKNGFRSGFSPKIARRRRTTRSSGQHLRLAQALPLAIGLNAFAQGKVYRLLCLVPVAQASGKPSLGLVLPLSSGVRLRTRNTHHEKRHKW